MEYLPADRADLMGAFHNQVVSIMDATALTPPEAIVVLRMIVNNTEALFAASVKAEKPEAKVE